MLIGKPVPVASSVRLWGECAGWGQRLLGDYVTSIPIRTQKPTRTLIIHHQKRARSCCSVTICSLLNEDV